jgi:hypothetical protein
MTALQTAALAYAAALEEYHATRLHADTYETRDNEMAHLRAVGAVYAAQNLLNSLAMDAAAVGWAA